jgi:hypothetical protein
MRSPSARHSGNLPGQTRDTSTVARRIALAVLMFVVATAWTTPAFAQGMDLRQAAGVPLPASDLPAGTVSVRVVRGSFANNLAGETVVFFVNGQERPQTTDTTGRAQIANLAPGTRVRAVATVSQEVTIGASGIRFVLVAGLDVAAPSAPPALIPAVPGSVSIGSGSRIVVEYKNELLNVYYVVQVVNAGQAPVDLGGPLVFELPTEARSVTPMEGNTPQATVGGNRVTVVGPFAPGTTSVNLAYTLPFDRDTARLEQGWPATAEPFPFFALKTGAMDIESSQLTGKQTRSQDGVDVVMGLLPTLTPGGSFAVDIKGLPHRPTWPRNVAVTAAGVISAVGLWAAFGPGSRRRRA